MRKIGIFTSLFVGVLLVVLSFILAFRFLQILDIVSGEFYPCCPYCAPGFWRIRTMLRYSDMDGELIFRLHLLGAIIAFVAGITGIVLGVVFGKKTK